MAFLASCWLIIESIVIPPGYFLKWFYLSFYIHPFLLCACQVFLCLKWLKRCILALLSYPFRVVCFFVFCVYKFCRCCIIYIFSFIKEVDSEEVLIFEAADNISQNQLISLCICSSMPSKAWKTEFVDANGCEDNHEILPGRESWNMEDWSFYCLQKDSSAYECSSSFCITPSMDESYLNESSPLFSSLSSPLMQECSLPACSSSSQVSEREVITTARDEDESDGFYKTYSERMRWFDILNHERTRGISEYFSLIGTFRCNLIVLIDWLLLGAIMNKEVGIPSSLENIKVKDLTIPYISWSKQDKKNLLRSLQSDFVLVYVGQSCLTWEALHHQHRKVKLLSFTNCLFAGNLAKDFQNFQVLLERFLEEERYVYKGKRAWNYVQARLASKTLLQVPKLTGISFNN